MTRALLGMLVVLVSTGSLRADDRPLPKGCHLHTTASILTGLITFVVLNGMVSDFHGSGTRFAPGAMSRLVLPNPHGVARCVKELPMN